MFGSGAFHNQHGNHHLFSELDNLTGQGLPTQCLCGLAKANQVRKWSLALTHLLETPPRSSTSSSSSALLLDSSRNQLDNSRRLQLRSLLTSLQQHLTLCFQLNDEDETELLDDLHNQNHFTSQSTTTSSSVSLPISVQLRVPEMLIHNKKVTFSVNEPQLNLNDNVWSSDLQLFVESSNFSLTNKEENKKQSVEVFDQMVSVTDSDWHVGSLKKTPTSPLPALDNRKKTLNVLLPIGHEEDQNQSIEDEEERPDWKKLERLEIEVWENLETVSPLQRQTSFYNYMKILTDELKKYQKDLEKLDRISNSHFQLVKHKLTKELLHDIVQNRLLRQDIKQEITFLENQIQHRAIVIEKDSTTGNEKRKPLTDRYTTRERFAKSTRTINKMIEVLKEQVDEQIKNSPSNFNGDELPSSVEEYEYFV